GREPHLLRPANVRPTRRHRRAHGASRRTTRHRRSLRMSLRDQSHTPSPGGAHRRALAAVKAHPNAATLAIVTLAVAIPAMATESRSTTRAQTGVVATHAARPQGLVPTVPATPGSTA